MSDQPKHPSFDEIDALRTGEGSEAAAVHVASCARCQGVLNDLQQVVLGLQRIRPQIEIPDAVDRHVLWLAQKQAASIRRGRHAPTRRWAMAAGLLLVLGAAGIWRWTATEQPHVALAQRDVDGNGRVDILDAFALARALKVGAAGHERWDIDADGHVDVRDVDLIARAAVTLGRI